MPHESHAARFNVRVKNLLSVVGRTIVDHNYFVMGIGLSPDRIQSFENQISAVKGGYDNGEKSVVVHANYRNSLSAKPLVFKLITIIKKQLDGLTEPFSRTNECALVDLPLSILGVLHKKFQLTMQEGIRERCQKVAGKYFGLSRIAAENL
jgi:hypothetical protein